MKKASLKRPAALRAGQPTKQTVIKVGTLEAGDACVSVDERGYYFTGQEKVTPEKAIAEVQRAWRLHCDNPPSDADIDLERVIALASEATKPSTLEQWLQSMPTEGFRGLYLRRYNLTLTPEWWPILLKVMVKQRATLAAVVEGALAHENEFCEVICDWSGEDKPIKGIRNTAAKGGAK